MSDISATSRTEGTAAAGAPQAPAGSGMSAMARVVGIFMSPVKTFRDIAARPTWLVPMLIGTLGTLAMTSMVMPKMDFEGMFLEGMQKSGRPMTDAEMDTAVKMMVPAATVFGYMSGVAGFPVICLISALIYFAVIRVFGGMTTYRKMLAVVCWSGLIYALKTVLSIIPLLGLERVTQDTVNALIPSNPAAFFTKEQVGGGLFAVFPFIDLFGVWGIVLTIIGLAAASNWSRGRCAATVIGIYATIMLIVGLLGMLGS